MCGEPVADAHQHVVNLESRVLMCTCRPCYLLFTDQGAQLRFRAVPDRYLSFPGFDLDGRQYDELEIPVGLAFLFTNSMLGKTIAFYPGPAGATESELPLVAWERIVTANPELTALLPDVEALLLRASDRNAERFSCHLVPIDACYELVGTLRQLWRGFDGGNQVHEAIDAFFADVSARSRPASAVTDTPAS